MSQGKAKPSIDRVFGWTSAADFKDPTNLVLVYSFGYYLQSSPERMNAFARLVRLIEYGDAIPLPIEMAKIYGFQSAEEFEADWIKFIKSQQFK
ncbi:MAG: hypothetical protein GWO24_33800 [Akkermansiaceae bacterium]|nr:hypothetical protein [Akkermansiaceae bacterium]